MSKRGEIKFPVNAVPFQLEEVMSPVEALGKITLKTNEILEVVNALTEITKDLEKKIDDVADVIDNLESEESTKPLSANMGRVLKGLVDLKVSISDIVNTLDSDALDKPLSANMGKRLKLYIGNLLDLKTELKNDIVSAINEMYLKLEDATEVINNLTSTDTTKPLSANMGRELDAKKINISDIVNSVHSTDATKPLSAFIGNFIWQQVGGKVDVGDIVNSLEDEQTQPLRKVLAAHQGTVLNERIGDLTQLDTTTKESVVKAINEVITMIQEQSGMKFKKLTCSGTPLKIYDGTTQLTLQQVKELYNSPLWFVYLEHLNVIFMPSSRYDSDNSFEFTGTFYNGDDSYTGSVMINNENVVTYRQVKAENQDRNKVYSLDDYDSEDDEQYFNANTTMEAINKKFEVIDVGSLQYIYDSYVLPKIQVNDLKKIYNNQKNNIKSIVKWSVLGSEMYLTILSCDKISDTYNIDILVRNKFNCQYQYTDSSTGNVDPIIVNKTETWTFTLEDGTEVTKKIGVYE